MCDFVTFKRDVSGEVGRVDDAAVFAVGFGMIEGGVGLIEKIGKFDGRIHSGETDAQTDGDAVSILFADMFVEFVHPCLRFWEGQEEQTDEFVAAPSAKEALFADVRLNVGGGQLQYRIAVEMP